MARSTGGPRRATTWAAEHRPRPLPRIVRLGRPANDNVRQFGRTAWLSAACIAVAAGLAALAFLHLI